MEIKVTVKLNSLVSLQATGEGKTLIEAIRQVNPLLAFRGKCELCGSDDITLQGKVAKSFPFTEFVCRGCHAKAQFGSYKEGGYFLKKWEVYQQNPPKEIDVNKDGVNF